MQKFQDLEEERLDFTKSSLWSFANIASTVCVSDDASCEKIRLALENCEVEKDILSFIKERGTGQEIPDPPRYINFCRGDLNDTASEASEDEKYSVAQFPRTVNPAFRSASPNPSTYESHHDPQSELAQQMGHGGLPAASVADDNDLTPSKTNSGRPRPLNYRPQEPNVPPSYSPSQHGDVANVPHNEYPTEGMTMFCRTGPPSVTGSGLSNNTRPSSRDSESEYSNPTSYTTADPVSGKNSPTKGMPPVNGVQLAGMSNPSPEKSIQKKRSGFFSNSPFRRKSKKEQDHTAHTPSTERSNRNTWAPQSAPRMNNTSATNINSTNSSPTKSFGRNNIFNRNQAPLEGEERADPRATFQLNVGNNVFDVASPDAQTTPKGRKGFAGLSSGEDMTMDPLKQALMDLQQGSGGMSKQSSTRVTADRYHGIKTPAPDTSVVRPPPLSAASADKIAAQRGTPPPAYEGARGGASPALGVPQPAFTSKEMRKRTETWGHNSNGSHVGHPSGRISQASRPVTRDDPMQRSRSPGPGMGGLPRAASPQPMRARSPAPDMMRGRSTGPQMNPNMRARSPAPPMNPNMRARSPAPPMDPSMRARSPAPPMMNGQGQYRTASPNPFGDGRHVHSRQNGGGMEMQLSSQDVQRYDAGGSGRSRNSMMDRGGRPGSAFAGDRYAQQQGGVGMNPQMGRGRSKSMAPAPVMSGMGGKAVLHYGKSNPAPCHTITAGRGETLTSFMPMAARALYSYSAAIPEELSFSKGDVLAVLRLQDDGWWEAQIEKGRQGVGMVGLVPSNYLQRL